jgi:outer membrane protein TolC
MPRRRSVATSSVFVLLAFAGRSATAQPTSNPPTAVTPPTTGITPEGAIPAPGAAPSAPVVSPPVPGGTPAGTPVGSPGATAGTPAAGVTVDERAPVPLSPAGETLQSWEALWASLPTAAADLRIALAEIERAEAATRIAWGAVLPSLTGTLTLSYAPPRAGRPFVITGPQLQGQLTATATLLNLRAFHQIGTQQLLEEVAGLGVLEVRRRLGLGLARAAASIAAAARLAEGNRTSLELALARLVLTRKRLAAGLGDQRDLVRAQQDVAAARALIAPADESVVQAQEALGTLLASTRSVGLSTGLESLEAQVRAFCGAQTAPPADRIDVLVARKQIEVAQRNVDDITLKFVPTLTAQATAGAFGQAFEGPYFPGWSISATISIPFYDGGVRYGEKRDRIALVEEAKARATQSEIASMIERTQARRAVDVAVAAQVAAREARDLAAEAERLSRVAYASGIGTNFDLIDAGRRLREAETTLVLRDLDVVRARLALPFVEGTCVGVTRGAS